MKRFAIISVTVLCLLALARCATAAETTPVSQPERQYCRFYAETEYQAAMARGDAFPDAAYEGAADECEVQWLMLRAQWDDPANIERVAVLAMRSGSVDTTDSEVSQ